MPTQLPRLWASDSLFTSGPSTGGATKIDPGAAGALQGYVPGISPFSPASLNFLLNQSAINQRRLLTAAMCRLREIRLDGTTITDTAEYMGVVSRGSAAQDILVCKTAQAFGISDSDRFRALGTPAQITSLLTSLARIPSTGRIVAVGTGGNRCTYTDDGGVNWFGGGNIGSTPTGPVFWNAGKSLLFVGDSTGLARSPDATIGNWVSPGSISVAPEQGCGVLASGTMVLLGTGTAPAFRRTTDSASSASATAGTIGSAGSADERGYIVANPSGTLLVHVCRLASGASLQINTSVDGDSWSARATFSKPSSSNAYNGPPRLLVCLDTGAMWLVCPLASGLTEVRGCTDPSAVLWTDPMYVADAPIAAFGAAGGRLVFTRDGMLFASDGIGWS